MNPWTLIPAALFALFLLAAVGIFLLLMVLEFGWWQVTRFFLWVVGVVTAVLVVPPLWEDFLKWWLKKEKEWDERHPPSDSTSSDQDE